MPLSISEEKPKITKFLTNSHIGVLATVNPDGQPYAATIYFIVDPDLKIYFITKEKTKKYDNLTSNPKVSLAVYEASSQTTVQITGTVDKILDNSVINDVFRHVVAITSKTSESAIPPISKLKGDDYRCFRINPKTIRMAEYTKPEHGQYDDIFEVIEFDV